MAQMVVRDECRGLRIRGVAEIPDVGVGRLEERVPGTEYLNSLALDLKPNGSGYNVSQHRADMDVETDALAGWQIDVLHLDQAVWQLGGQEMRSRYRIHAEY